MSVARRAGSGAASASLYWCLRQRVQYAFESIRGGCCFLDERVRRASCWAAECWAAAARASRSCWAAEATRRCWAAAARAACNSAIFSGPFIVNILLFPSFALGFFLSTTFHFF